MKPAYTKLRMTMIDGVILLLFLLTLHITSFSQSNGYVIKGRVIGVDTGSIYMKEDNSGKTVATGRLNSGKFVITGKITEPVKCTVSTNFNYEPIPLFLENTHYNLLIHNNPFSYALSGGELQKKFMEYGNVVSWYYDGWEQIKWIIRENSSSDTSEKYKKIMNELDSSAVFLEKEIIKKSEVYIQENKDSYITPRIISNILMLNKKYVRIADSLYNVLTERIKKSSEGKDLKNWISSIEKAPAVGSTIQLFTLRNDKGGETPFKKPGKGEYVLINFWASWCYPCIREFPSLVQVYNQFKEKGFEIINVSIDTDKQRWLKYLSAKEYPWPQVIDNVHTDSSLAKIYRIRTIPFNFLINENLKIVAIDLAVEQLELKLKDLFKN